MAEPNLQISKKLFVELLDYFYADDDIQRKSLELDIRRALDERLDRMLSRQIFTEYKRVATPEEREAARKEYLDHREIHPDWRTDREIRER